MKKYPKIDECTQREAIQQRLDELKLFQSLLRESEAMNAMYHGKAEAIAYGIQPWIEALELRLLE